MTSSPSHPTNRPLEPGPAPRARPALAALGAYAGVLLPWLVAGAAVSDRVFGYISTSATTQADTRNDTVRRHEFEVDVDKRFNAANARLDATDHDRDVRFNTIVHGQADMAGEMNRKIDDLGRMMAERSEKRTAQMNDLAQRVSTLETKLCMAAGNKLSGCR